MSARSYFGYSNEEREMQAEALQTVWLRCLTCYSKVSPSEMGCAGCGAVFSPEEIKRVMEPTEGKEAQ